MIDIVIAFSGGVVVGLCLAGIGFAAILLKKERDDNDRQ